MTLILRDFKENKVTTIYNILIFNFEYLEINNSSYWLHIYEKDKPDYYMEIDPKKTKITIINEGK